MTTPPVRPYAHVNNCPCTSCRVYRNARRYAGRVTDGALVMVPAGPVREWLRILGGRPSDVAYLSGVHKDTILGCRSGRHKRMHRVSARAILLVRPEEVAALGAARMPLRRLQPVGPSMRRLQGLAAQGWSLPQLSARTGIHQDSLKVIRLGLRKWVQTTNATAIETVADVIEDAPGPSHQSRHLAERFGWLPLIWGSDEQIAEQCEVYGCQPADLPRVADLEARDVLLVGALFTPGRKPSIRVHERRRQVAAMRDAGLSIAETAARLNASVKTVTKDRSRLNQQVAA